jgi:hypothetical protein
MRNSYNYCVRNSEGKNIGHLLINELPEFQIKGAHFYDLDTALPHVFDNFPFNKDYLQIAEELITRAGKTKPFHLVEGLNLEI